MYLPSTDVGRVPFRQQHFLDMQDPDPLPIWRPEIFVNCRHSHLTDEECIRLLELYRSFLIPRKTIESGNFRGPETFHFDQRESYHLDLNLLNFNLGSIKRQPAIGGNVCFPKHFRDDPDCVVLPHVVLRNGAHIISLCEASDDRGGMQRHQQLARDNAILGMVVHAETSAQSIGLFIRGTQEDELFSQYQYESQTQNEAKKFWTFHACIFRVSFGHITSGEMVGPTYGIWTSIGTDQPTTANAVQPHLAPLCSIPRTFRKNQSPKSRAAKQSRPPTCIKRQTVQTGWTYAGWDSPKCALRPFIYLHLLGETRTQTYVTNGLCSCRIACPIKWISSWATATQRNFKQDRHSDFRSCILIDLLERFLNQLSSSREPISRLTYNVVSNTQAGEYIKSMQGDTSASCDCLLTISLCDGKQTVVAEDRATRQSDNTDESAFSDEVLLNDIEQPKHLLVYDLGLKDSDCDFIHHSCASHP